jgi:hypothetical protein
MHRRQAQKYLAIRRRLVGVSVIGLGGLVKLGRRGGPQAVERLEMVLPALFAKERSKGQGPVEEGPIFTLRTLLMRVEPRVNRPLYQFSSHQTS